MGDIELPWRPEGRLEGNTQSSVRHPNVPQSCSYQHLGKSPSKAVGWRGAGRPLLAVSPSWRISSHPQHHLADLQPCCAFLHQPPILSVSCLASSTEPRSSSGLWIRQHFIKRVGGRAGEPWGGVTGRGPVQGLCSLSTPCPSRVPTQGKGKLHQSSGQLILSRAVFLPVQKFWVEIHFLKYCFWLRISKQHEKFLFSWKCFL